MTPLLARWMFLLVPSALILFALSGAAVPSPKRNGAILMSFLWSALGLFFVFRLGVATGWWEFHIVGGQAWGVPIDLCLAGGAMCGAFPQLGDRRLGRFLGASCLFMALLVMATPILNLHPGALLGAVTAHGVALFPAQLLAKWTRESTFLRLRMFAQIVVFGLLSLFVLPAAALAHGSGALDFLFSASMSANTLLMVIALVLTLAFAAVHDFVALGEGTPLPFDPPTRLVSGGLYAYIANPMQSLMTIALLLLALGLKSAYLAAGACTAFVFSMGVAKWEEHTSLVVRFGDRWTDYRRHVAMWWPRWRPYAQERATYVYLRDCSVCESTVAWLEQRKPVGLDFVALQDTNLDVERATYARGPHVATGVAAIGRALEHLHLGWALFGCLMRLPVLSSVLQLFADAVGGGPMLPASQKEDTV